MNEWLSAKIAASIVGLISVWLGLLVVLQALPRPGSLPFTPCITRTNSFATSPRVAVPVGLSLLSADVVMLPLMMMLFAAAIVTGEV